QRNESRGTGQDPIMEHRLPSEAARHHPRARFRDEADGLGAGTVDLRPTSPSPTHDGPAAPPSAPAPAVRLSPAARAFLDKLLHLKLLEASVLDPFLGERGPGLAECDTP